MMKQKISAITLLLAATMSSPALADNSTSGNDAMVEASALPSHQAISIPVQSFDLSGVTNARHFMATAETEFMSDYRLQKNDRYMFQKSSAGLAELLVPEEFIYRSTAQDSGVDAVTPGRFLSESVRSDYLANTGPAAKDKSSIGIRFGF